MYFGFIHSIVLFVFILLAKVRPLWKFGNALLQYFHCIVRFVNLVHYIPADTFMKYNYQL